MSLPSRTVWLMVASATVVAGCATVHPSGDSAPESPPDVPAAPEPIVLEAERATPEPPGAPVSALTVKNETPWAVEVELERVRTGGRTVLGRIEAGERRTFDGLPAREWVAFYAPPHDGGEALRRSAVPLQPFDTTVWVVRRDTGSASSPR